MITRDTYDLNAEILTHLRDNVAIIKRNKNEKAILKEKRKSYKGNWINSHRFNNELRIYKFLKINEFKFLHTPKLIDYGAEWMILQYIDKDPDAKISLQEFVRAYSELQRINIPYSFWFDLKNQMIRGFYYKGIVTPLITLPRDVNFKKVLKTVYLFLKLNFLAPKLDNKYWLHGDITTKNIYHNSIDGLLYFLDFENLYYTRNWLLVEILQLCLVLNFEKMSLSVDIKYLRKYLITADTPVKNDLQKIDIKQQFRFSILILCISSIAMAKSKWKKTLYKNYLDIIIEDSTYNEWFKREVTPGLNRLRQDNIQITDNKLIFS